MDEGIACGLQPHESERHPQLPGGIDEPDNLSDAIGGLDFLPDDRELEILGVPTARGPSLGMMTPIERCGGRRE